MKTVGPWLLAALLLAGCARGTERLQVARAEAQVCKHCNCYMPAGIADDAPCTVCNCGYKAGRCTRGRRE